MRRSLIFIFILFWACIPLYGQNPTKKWDLGGYIKYLHAGYLTEGFPLQTDQLLHNRLNFKWYPHDLFNIQIESRNRAFWGDIVSIVPNYPDLIDEASQDILDLGFVLVEGRGFIMHSTFDRLFTQFQNDHWIIRLGRQRINWGINTIWNPNDLFNAYSFVDFDYEERPGSDALRIQYSYGFASGLELVFRPGNESTDHILGTRWNLNTKGYDLQFLLAQSPDEWTIGTGWAGNLGNWGWKGELSSFIESEGSSWSFATTADYTFNNSDYVSFGYLYNGNGSTLSTISELFRTELSAKNLYPYKHSLLIQYAHAFNPLLNTNFGVIYSPNKAHPLFMFPALTYSIVENWDLDLVGQVVFNKEGNFQSPIQAFFGRIKFSF